MAKLSDDREYLAMKKLWCDAKARGMTDLAEVYGWTVMRLGQELIEANGRLLAAMARDPGLAG